jgi:hypothetical protein
MLSELAGEGTRLLGEFTNGIIDADGNAEKMDEVVSKTISNFISSAVKNTPKIIR